jgi:hypothetical protein
MPTFPQILEQDAKGQRPTSSCHAKLFARPTNSKCAVHLLLSLVTRAAMLGTSLTLKMAFLQLRTQTSESGLERLRSRLAATGG